jgi:hypothetical protein
MSCRPRRRFPFSFWLGIVVIHSSNNKEFCVHHDEHDDDDENDDNGMFRFNIQ